MAFRWLFEWALVFVVPEELSLWKLLLYEFHQVFQNDPGAKLNATETSLQCALQKQMASSAARCVVLCDSSFFLLYQNGSLKIGQQRKN